MIKYGHTDTKNKRTDTLDILQTKTGCNKAASYICLRRVRKGEVLLILILMEDSRGILHMLKTEPRVSRGFLYVSYPPRIEL